jgi:hypothetical protein
MKLYWKAGWLLIGIGCIHNAIGLLFGWNILAAMVSDGLWNTVEPQGEINFARSAILWFLLTGCFWWLLGGLMQVMLNQGFLLPRWLGAGLAAAGVVVSIIIPASGAWLFIPLGALVFAGPGRTTAKIA